MHVGVWVWVWVHAVCVCWEGEHRHRHRHSQADPSLSLSPLLLSSPPFPTNNNTNTHIPTHTHTYHILTPTRPACTHWSYCIAAHTGATSAHACAANCRFAPLFAPAHDTQRHRVSLHVRKFAMCCANSRPPLTPVREGRDRQEENGAATRGHSGFMHATHRHVWPVAYWCSRASCADPSNPPSQPTKKKVQFALSTHAVCLCLRFF